jgi:hypothetical protein
MVYGIRQPTAAPSLTYKNNRNSSLATDDPVATTILLWWARLLGGE